MKNASNSHNSSFGENKSSLANTLMLSKAILKALTAIIGFAIVLYLIMQVVFFISPEMRQRFTNITSSPPPASVPIIYDAPAPSLTPNVSITQPVAPPPIQTILYLEPGVESRQITNTTAHFNSDIDNNSKVDIRIVKPDGTEKIYRNVTEKTKLNLHLTIGTKMSWKSKKKVKVTIRQY